MQDEKKFKSALNVMEGISQPEQINADAVQRLKAGKRSSLSVREFTEGIFAGNRTILGKAITLIESARADHQEMAREIIAACLEPDKSHPGSSSGKSVSKRENAGIRIGITGVPGVGKSTFIEALGMHLTDRGHKLAVLAIDPSSTRSKGSILGDKTRMELLSANPHAFIRPSPSAGSLGGVARKTRETILLCEAAGFDVVFVETVGVGQSETAVHGMVDFFLLLMLSGAGDELQGIKRGIMEMADGLLINKADGDNLDRAKRAQAEYRHALHFFPPASSGWNPRVEICSATTGFNIPMVWDLILEYRKFTDANGYFLQRRQEQNLEAFREALQQSLYQHFFNGKEISRDIREAEDQLRRGLISPYEAAAVLLQRYLGSSNAGHLT